MQEIKFAKKSLEKSLRLDEVLLSLKTLLKAEGKNLDIASFCCEKREDNKYNIKVTLEEGEEITYISSEA